MTNETLRVVIRALKIHGYPELAPKLDPLSTPLFSTNCMRSMCLRLHLQLGSLTKPTIFYNGQVEQYVLATRAECRCAEKYCERLNIYKISEGLYRIGDRNVFIRVGPQRSQLVDALIIFDRFAPMMSALQRPARDGACWRRVGHSGALFDPPRPLP
jgi:hypothetical protein